MQSNINIKSYWSVTVRKRMIEINLSGLKKVIILIYS